MKNIKCKIACYSRPVSEYGVNSSGNPEVVAGFSLRNLSLRVMVSVIASNISSVILSKAKNLILSLVIICITLLFISPISAAPIGKGGKPGALLIYGAGARALGMGKAYVSVVDDATATLWNTGALAQVDQKELTALHAILWADTNYDFVSYVHPTLDMGTFGLNLLYLSSGGFEERDIYNVPGGTFGVNEMAISLAYGAYLMENISLGGSVKYYSRTLAKDIDAFILTDLGIITEPFEDARLGLTLQDFLTIMHLGAATQDKIPLMIRGGLSYRFLRKQMTVAFDVDSDSNWYVGTEYKLFRLQTENPLQIALRVGANYEEFTVGFGAYYRDYGLDYAFGTHELGGSHRFSATARFGESMSFARLERERSIELAKQEEANSYYKMAVADYKTGLYAASLEKLNKAIELDPKNADSLALVNKMQSITSAMPKETGDSRESDLIRRGVEYYIDSNPKMALNMLEYVSSKQPENERLIKLGRMIAAETNLDFKGGKTKEGMDVVSQKLYESLGYFYEGKYDKVIEKCQDVLELEPSNLTALMRIGSGYYAIQQKDKAREAWQKALMLDPTNKDLQNFLKRVSGGEAQSTPPGMK